LVYNPSYLAPVEEAQISGNFILDEAFQPSVNLKSGILPASLDLACLEKLGNSPSNRP
jgi:preprotein translocase subunit SecD